MIRRALLLSLAVVALVAAPVAGQEEAPDYDGPSGESEVQGDESIRVTGEGCPPNATITYTVTRDGAAFSEGTASADANGDFDFVVETDGPGEYRVTVECGDQTFMVTATVAGETAERPGDDRRVTGPLPETGSDSSIPLTQAGVALLMIGGVAVYAAKRRRARNFT